VLLVIAFILLAGCASHNISSSVKTPAPIITKLGTIHVDARPYNVRLYDDGSRRLIKIFITKQIPKVEGLQGMLPETTKFEAFVKLTTGEFLECQQLRYPTGAPGISQVGHVTFVHDIVIPGPTKVQIQEVFIDLDGHRSCFNVPPPIR